MSERVEKCIKCGAVNENPRYHVGGYWTKSFGPKCETSDLADDSKDGLKTEEHLHYYCRCGFDWITRLAGEETK